MRYADSFFLHLRPKYYPPRALAFSTTYYLGFLSVLLLVLEFVTGAVLMVYYAPTPEAAYGSIVRLSSEVSFGSLLRDLHRLGGELMIVVVVLHLLKVFLKGSFTGAYGFTWVTGVLLLLCTLLLAFSGYLLPWDQLAYWAVTIGTSIADTIPGIGTSLTLLLRGGPEFGPDGLLRFYLLHVIAVPLFMLLLLGIHYFRVLRLHPASRKEQAGERGAAAAHTPGPARKPFLPDVALLEYALSLATVALLVAAAAFFYDAPLEHHADPRHTPADTRAPWFFLWLQGALKLGDSFVTGVVFPVLLVVILLILPSLASFMPRWSNAAAVRRAVAGCAVLVLLGLTVLGLPRYGVHQGPVAALIQDYMPDGRPSRFHDLGYDNVPLGLYNLAAKTRNGAGNSPFASLLAGLDESVAALSNAPEIGAVKGVLIVEDWQADLKRVTLRISWTETPSSESAGSRDQMIFLHRFSG